jgi:O-antigen/teichoic acid export membrane protein
MLIGVAGAVVNLVSNLFAIPAFGMVGAASTTLATELMVFGAIIWSTRDMALPPLLSALRFALPVSAATGFVAFVTRESLWGVPVTLAVYGVALVATSAVPTATIRALVRGSVRAE